MSNAEGRRVIAGVSGSPGSLAALHRAADEARRTDAELLVVLAWEPPGGDLANRRSIYPVPVADHRRDADRRLLAALDTAFGDTGPGVPYRGLVVRGTPGRALVETADQGDDLLVVGVGCRGRLRRALFPSVARYCLAHAACPVLAVPPSPLENDLASVHRRISLRMPLDARELTDGPLALRGVRYTPSSAHDLLRRNLLLYGLGGLVLPFVGIKLIDLVISGVPGLG